MTSDSLKTHHLFLVPTDYPVRSNIANKAGLNEIFYDYGGTFTFAYITKISLETPIHASLLLPAQAATRTMTAAVVFHLRFVRFRC